MRRIPPLPDPGGQPSNGRPTPTGSALLGLSVLGMLVALSYPVVTVSVCLGALGATALRERQRLPATVQRSRTHTDRRTSRRCCEPAD
jgi:hypothetical protein